MGSEPQEGGKIIEFEKFRKEQAERAEIEGMAEVIFLEQVRKERQEKQDRETRTKGLKHSYTEEIKELRDIDEALLALKKKYDVFFPKSLGKKIEEKIDENERELSRLRKAYNPDYRNHLKKVIKELVADLEKWKASYSKLEEHQKKMEILFGELFEMLGEDELRAFLKGWKKETVDQWIKKYLKQEDKKTR